MDTLTCHGESLDVQGRNPGKLAVIAPMLERIKLEAIINQHIPADEQAEFDHGAILRTVPEITVPLSPFALRKKRGFRGAKDDTKFQNGP